MDDRLQRLTRIGNAVIGVEVGGRDARVNIATRALAATATKVQSVFAEINAHSQMLDSEKGRRKAELGGPYSDELKKAANILAEEGARVANAMKTATAVRGYGDHTPLHQLMTDFALVQAFNQKSANEREQALAMVLRDPSTATRTSEALLRADIELTGMTQEQHDQLRWAVLTDRDPATAEMLLTERQQVAHLRTALQMATKVLTDASPGAHMELSQSAPEVISAIQETE